MVFFANPLPSKTFLGDGFSLTLLFRQEFIESPPTSPPLKLLPTINTGLIKDYSKDYETTCLCLDEALLSFYFWWGSSAGIIPLMP